MSDQMEGQEPEEMVEVLVEGIDQIPEEEPAPEPEPEEEQFRGLDRPALIKRMKESEKKAQDTISNATQAFSGAVDRLGQTLGQRPTEQPPVVPTGPAPLTREQLVEQVTGNIMERPVQALDQYTQATFGPVIQTITSNNLATFRKLARLERGQVFDKYSDQIDQWVKTRPAYEQMQSNIYDRAFAEVMMQNIDAVVEERAQEVAKKRMEQNREPVESAPTREAMYTERGGSAAPRQPTARSRRVILTEAERRDADARGVDYEVYAKKYKGVPW